MQGEGHVMAEAELSDAATGEGVPRTAGRHWEPGGEKVVRWGFRGVALLAPDLGLQNCETVRSRCFKSPCLSWVVTALPFTL